jgi:hypothetical protein
VADHDRVHDSHQHHPDLHDDDGEREPQQLAHLVRLRQ